MMHGAETMADVKWSYDIMSMQKVTGHAARSSAFGKASCYLEHTSMQL